MAGFDVLVLPFVLAGEGKAPPFLPLRCLHITIVVTFLILAPAGEAKCDACLPVSSSGESA